MSNPPGYPLPAGELGEDDIVCQLVFLPNRPEYWQAFISALHYFATWKAWERDSALRGKDAAANWSAANELTMECWRMACLQDLQDDVAAILAIMQLPQSCCDPGDYSDGAQYTDRVEDGVGNVPQNIIDAGYATGTSDWDGFDDYKCVISHVIVSQIEARLTEILPLVDATGAVLGGVAALAGILAVVVGTGGLAIVFGIVAGIGATALLYQAITDFDLVEGLITKVATNHDELACAVYNGDGDEGSLIALNDKIDELFTTVEALVLTNMNLGPTLKALYAGRYDQQDIAQILDDAGYETADFNCMCDVVEIIGFTEINPAVFSYAASLSPPNCEHGNSSDWSDFRKLEGNPNVWGDCIVRGYVHIQGTMTEHANCTGIGHIWIEQSVNVDNVDNFAHHDSADRRIYHEIGGLTGTLDLYIPFDETWTTVGNIYTISVRTHVNCGYGVIDIDTNTVITYLEIV